MTDVLTPEQRHKCMSNIKSKNTKPELVVRRLIFHMGYRYRLHRKDLPGKPDITFAKMKKVIFIHGCFWHKHDCPKGQSKPKTNSDFWGKKRVTNIERDKKNIQELRSMGWQVLVIWECWISNLENCSELISNFLTD